ncbi:MAG: SGNH/GDSL hydrolase family protein [Deltaproteobacteria bacterium]|nr:SGNH/GDSL hydrolase family protein [Deltaproteobacteria bacterium]
MAYQVDGDGQLLAVPAEAQERIDDDEPRLWGAAQLIKEHTIVLHWLGRQVNRWRKGSLADYPINWKVSSWTIEAELSDKARQGLDRATEHMDELARLARREGIVLTVAVYPWPDQIYHRDRESRHVDHWRAWARRHGAHFIDHFPCFVGDGDPIDVIDRYYIRGDVHWNREGHKLVAERFLKSYRGR